MATYDLTSSIPSASSLKAGDILNCPYSGTYKSITLPAGTYKLECWGAQGGSGDNGTGSAVSGGKGGYSYGILKSSLSIVLYLYTGGIGNSSNGHTAIDGGYNGGGAGAINSSNSSSSGALRGSGGGASDIRIGSTSLYARVIVAGGGGGTGGSGSDNSGTATTSGKFATIGGAGGGTSGIAGVNSSDSARLGGGGGS